MSGQRQPNRKAQQPPRAKANEVNQPDADAQRREADPEGPQQLQPRTATHISKRKQGNADRGEHPAETRSEDEGSFDH